jgi:AAA domain
VRYLTYRLRDDLQKKMVLLAGPRQCGKTTLAKSLLNSRGEYLNWDITKDRNRSAASGCLRIVPTGEARKALASDYAAMLADEVMLGEALPFDRLMQACAEVETKINKAGASP